MICRNRHCRKELPDDAVFCSYCGYKQDVKEKHKLHRPHGSGTVYKLSDKRRSKPWVAARNKVILGYAATKTEAMDILGRSVDVNITDKYNATFEQVYNEWKAEHFRDLTEKGAEGYENAYLRFAALYKNKFRDLKAKDYQAIIDGLANEGKSVSLMQKHKQLVGQMCKYAMREGIITVNQAPFVKIPTEVKKEKAIFTDEEIDLIRKDGSEEAQIVLMLIYTGARIGELFGAKLSDYHETYFIGGEKTEAGRNRVIPIPLIARQYFQHFAAKASETILGGFSGNKQERNFRRREYADLMKRLNIVGKSPHCARHTFITKAASSEVKPELLQKIVGHANYSTTANVYIHANSGELVSAVENLFN